MKYPISSVALFVFGPGYSPEDNHVPFIKLTTGFG